MQYKNIENYDLVKEALIEANRRDLIGFGPECLIPSRPIGQGKMQNQGRNKTGQSRGSHLDMLEVVLLHRSIRLRENVKGDLRDETMDGIYCVNAFCLRYDGVWHILLSRGAN